MNYARASDEASAQVANLSSRSSFENSKILFTRRYLFFERTDSYLPKCINENIESGLTEPILSGSDKISGDTSVVYTAPSKDVLDACIGLEFLTNKPRSSDDTHVATDMDTHRYEFIQRHGFSWRNFIVFSVSVFSYIADIVSDAFLAITYYLQGDLFWSALTASLMMLPALVMTGLSLSWYYLDKRACVDPSRTPRAWTIRIFFHVLQLAPLVRLFDALLYGIASRREGISLSEAVYFTRLMLFEDADSCMLRLMECFMEAAPQLLLQLYILLTQPRNMTTTKLSVQYISCVSSWLSLAWCLTSYQAALRCSRVEKAKLRWSSGALYFAWKAGVLAARLVALALFAAAYRAVWFFATFGLHWIASVTFLIALGTTFCSVESSAPAELAFDLVLGAVYCFDVINTREGPSRAYYTAWYCLMAAENSLFSVIWFLRPWLPESLQGVGKKVEEVSSLQSSRDDWLPRWAFPLFVLVAFLFGLLMMVVYYLCAHPSKKYRIHRCKAKMNQSQSEGS